MEEESLFGAPPSLCILHLPTLSPRLAVLQPRRQSRCMALSVSVISLCPFPPSAPPLPSLPPPPRLSHPGGLLGCQAVTHRRIEEHVLHSQGECRAQSSCLERTPEAHAQSSCLERTPEAHAQSLCLERMPRAAGRTLGLSCTVHLTQWHCHSRISDAPLMLLDSTVPVFA